MIHDVKNYPILQVCSQKPSRSSKYEFEDRGGMVLDTHLFMLERWNWHKIQESHMTIHDVKNDPIDEVSSQ